MRRSQSMLAIGALAAVLWPAAAFAAFPVPDAAITPQAFGRAIFARLFGETGDRLAARYAAVGEELAESPLRDHVLVVPSPAPALIAREPVVSLAALAARYDDAPLLASAAVISPRVSIATPGAPPAPVALYQGVAPAPAPAPSLRRFDLTTGSSYTAQAPSDLVSFSPVMIPSLSFDAGASGPDATATLAQTQADVAVPMRVGRVRFETHAEAAQAQSSQLALADRAVGAGATFDVRAGARNLGVDLSSRYEHLTLQTPQFNGASFDQNTQIGIAGTNVPVFVPAYADISKQTLSAGVAVPITRRLTASVQYDSQHLLGGYGSPGLNNLDAHNDVYGASVVFTLPKSSSQLALTAKQYRYQDNLSPSTYTQTSANVDFTVKF